MRFDPLERRRVRTDSWLQRPSKCKRAEDLLEMEIIDDVIEEPLGGAHHDPKVVYDRVKKYILSQWSVLKAFLLKR